MNKYIRSKALAELDMLNLRIDRRGGKPTKKQDQEHQALRRVLQNTPKQLKVKSLENV